MVDVATLVPLGLAVDSSQVEKGAKSLDKLAGSAKKAEAATSALGPASQAAGRSAANAAEAAARALDAQASAAQRAANANMRVATSANDNAFKAGAHNVSNIAAQFQDVAVSAAGGMAAMQVGLQQGTQLAAVIGTMERPLAGLGAAFLSILSPLSLLVIGLTTLAAAGIQMVNWASVGATALRGLATALQVVAPYAAAVAAALALIYAPAIVSGIASVTVAIGRLAVAAVSATAAMAAANPVVAIALGIAAAITAAIAFRDELAKILGVDIVGAAVKGVNYIIGSFVAAFNDIKFVWSNLGDIIGASVIGATNAVVNGLNAMVQKAVGMIDGLIGMVNKIPGVNIPLIGEVAPMTPAANPYADRLAKSAATRGAQQQQELNANYIGQFGGAVSFGASTAAGKLRDLANQLLTDPGKKGKGGKTDAEKYDDIISAADRRIAQLKAEAEGLGLTEEAAARLRYETELLNQADQKGIDLSAAQRAELGAKAAAMAQVEIAAKNVKAAFDFAKDATGGFLSDLRTGLQNGEGFFKSFGNAALNVLNKIIDKLQGSFVDSLFSSGGTGGAGGIFGTLFSGLKGLFGFDAGGYTGSGPASAVAGVVHGGEYVFSKRATDRIGVGNLEAMHKSARGYASGGYVGASIPSRPANNNGKMHVSIGVTVDDQGNLQAYVKSIGEQATRDGAAAGAALALRQVPSLAVQAVQSHQRRLG